MSLLSQCPELVTQLIAWYQWKAKIWEINNDYKSNKISGSTHNFHIMISDEFYLAFQYRKMQPEVRREDMYIYRIYKGSAVVVAYKKVNTWLPDFY